MTYREFYSEIVSALNWKAVISLFNKLLFLKSKVIITTIDGSTTGQNYLEHKPNHSYYITVMNISV